MTSDEGTKHGVELGGVMGLIKFINTDCPNLKFRGLMSMGKLNDIAGF